ncbi:MupA/Atu3671 family FMN-dependent luciferase-like monooxygenase [Nocardia sp. NPDC055029]
MDLSLFYFSSSAGAGGSYSLLLDGAKFADAEGLSAVWTPERHFHRFGGLFPNAAVTSAAVAAVTERVSVRAGSVIAPLHHPLRIVEDWSVVDNLSGGRAGVAFASGWNSQDFLLEPGAYADRRNIVLETADEVRALWRGKPAVGADGLGNQIEVEPFPRPVQGDLPIWLTSGGSPETFAAAGRGGYGVLTHLIGQDMTALAAKIELYRAELAKSAAPQRNEHVTVMLHTFLGEDREQIKDIVREPFSAYLRDSVDLLAKAADLAGGPGLDALSEQDRAGIVDFAFERYFRTSALFGTLEDALEICDQLADIGVDEVACLVDFGVPADLVRESFSHLGDLNKILQS